MMVPLAIQKVSPEAAQFVNGVGKVSGVPIR